VKCRLGPHEWIEVTDAGLVYCKLDARAVIEGEAPVLRVPVTFQPVSVYAATVPADSGGNHGIGIKLRNTVGIIHEANNGFLQWLAQRGVKIDLARAKILIRYMAAAQPTKQIIAYERTGWQVEPTGQPVFVLGDRVIGATLESVYQPGDAVAAAHISQSDSLPGWIKHVAEPACVVPWWGFSIMAALGGMLLRPLDEPSRGFQATGETSQGKTIGLACGASVYGRGSKRDENSFISTWNNTSNAIEGMSEAHNDLMLPFDELREADSNTINRILYMMIDGAGRGRMKKDASLRPRKHWSTVVLSTGEQSIESKLGEGGHAIAGGMAVRMLDLPVDNTGLVRRIDADHVKRIEAATRRYYGTAAEAFVSRLIEDQLADPEGEGAAHLRQRLSDITAELVGSDTDERRRRAARGFAIVQLAGELGIK
jgi:putative DNA primase/helicase